MFLLGTLLSAIAQVPSYVPKDSLKGWWPFSGNANDASGNNLNGFIRGVAVQTDDRFNNSNSAYYFNQKNNIGDGIAIADNSILALGTGLNQQLSISVWFYEDSLLSFGLNGELGFIVKKGSLSSNSSGVDYAIVHEANDLVWGTGRSYINGGDKCAWTDGLVKASKKNWHHYIATLNQNVNNTAGIKNIYLDGTLYNSCSYVNKNSSNVDSLYIGSKGFKGKIDDIGIWNRALTAKEITDLYIGCKLAISTEPSNQFSSINSQAQFIAFANDTNASYLWQSKQVNLSWGDIPSSSFYSGITTKKLIVNNIQVNNHKQLFRVIATKNTCKDTSVVAMLTVNDTCITSTRDTLYIKVNTSSLSNPVYNTVKVYPNPSSTQVIIDNGNYSTMGSYTAKIVNTAGQQVFQSVINQQQFVIDAKTMGGAGVYTLYISDANNKVVGVKKIVLQ